MESADGKTADSSVSPERPPLRVIFREWGRIGCIGFGGPPAHIALLRELCLDRRRWLSEEEFEHGIAATNLLPGPGSTQLAIFCAWRLRGVPGALVGGLSFIIPGLLLIIPLAALFLNDPPEVILGFGAGAGAVVAAVAVQAGISLVPGSRARMSSSNALRRWSVYAFLGALATVLIGPLLVLVLLACGVVEMIWQRSGSSVAARVQSWPPLLIAAAGSAGLGALAWTAFKVGALAYGGGFVIIPLMQADAVENYGWMTDGQFLNAVALGQATPGPVVHTVAVVGYAAAGVGGALLAAVIAFAPSFSFIMLGARRFDLLRTSPRPRAFLDGAGPAAIGAIIGSAVPLALALSEAWQFAVLALGAVLLLAVRLGVVWTLLVGAVIGAIIGLAGGPLPS